jgi:hypothetical protein
LKSEWKICDRNNHLTNRSEPADTELGTGIGGTGRDQERGDGGVELRRHCLHPPLVQRVSSAATAAVLEEADGRGVSLEGLIRERVNLPRSNCFEETERNPTALNLACELRP